MMKNNTEQTPSFWANAAQAPWIQGPFLGVGAMLVATPSLKWTNHRLKGEEVYSNCCKHESNK